MIILSPEGKAQTSGAKIASLPQFTELRGKVVGWLAKPFRQLVGVGLAVVEPTDHFTAQ